MVFNHIPGEHSCKESTRKTPRQAPCIRAEEFEQKAIATDYCRRVDGIQYNLLSLWFQDEETYFHPSRFLLTPSRWWLLSLQGSETQSSTSQLKPPGRKPSENSQNLRRSDNEVKTSHTGWVESSHWHHSLVCGTWLYWGEDPRVDVMFTMKSHDPAPLMLKRTSGETIYCPLEPSNGPIVLLALFYKARSNHRRLWPSRPVFEPGLIPKTHPGPQSLPLYHVRNERVPMGVLQILGGFSRWKAYPTLPTTNPTPWELSLDNCNGEV